MTTIAFKEGVMASDSCISGGGIRWASVSKVLRTSAGALIGWSGQADNREVLALLDKVKDPAKLPTKQQIIDTRTDFQLLIAFSPTSLYVVTGNDEEDGRFTAYVNFLNLGMAAVGCGSELALGAMAAGKSAREAVEIACQLDTRSNLPVHSIAFESKIKQRPKPKPRPK